MSLQNLLKKLIDKIKSINKNEIILFFKNTKKELIIFLLCFFVMVLIMLMFLSRCDNSVSTKKSVLKERLSNAKIEESESDKSQKMFLIQGALLFPEYLNKDLTADYQDLYPLNNYNMENMVLIEDELDLVINNSIDDSLKFNFEKRSK